MGVEQNLGVLTVPLNKVVNWAQAQLGVARDLRLGVLRD